MPWGYGEHLVRPVALVIVDKDGHVRVEPLRAATSVIEKAGEAVAHVLETRRKTEAASEAGRKAD